MSRSRALHGLAIAAAASATLSAGPLASAAVEVPALITKVEVVLRPEGALVVQDVTLARPPSSRGALSLYVAYGAPGAPRAIDARIAPLPDGVLELDSEAKGTALAVTPRTSKAPGDVLLLGRGSMAGFAVDLPDRALRDATSESSFAVLRLRTLLAIPFRDGESAGISARAAGEALVRLETPSPVPMALGRVIVRAEGGLALREVQASLCGPDATPFPLAISARGLDGSTPRPPATRVAPLLAVRHASDALCVRWLLR